MILCTCSFAPINGQAERKLRHILDTVRALLLSAKVPAPFWGEATFDVVHLINRIQSTVIHNQTPYECLFGSPPDYHHLHSFGFAYFVLLQLMSTTNLSLDLDFVVSLVMTKLKKGIGVMILSLIVFVFLVMLSFGNTDYLLNFLTFVLP